MASSSPTLAFPDLSNTFGALFIGLVLSTALWGITSTQAYTYVRKFPNDSRILKVLVIFVWIVDTLQQALVSHALWHFLIADYFHPFSLLISVWSLDVMIALTSLMSLIVQTYFGIRVHQISRGNYFLSGPIIILAVTTFAFGIVLTVKALILKLFTAAQREIALVSVHIGCAVVCDLIITCSLIWYLHHARTGWRKTDTVIDKLLITTVNRGLLVCVCAVVELVCFVEMPDNMIYLGLHFIVGKLYAISWLGALNTRRALHGRATASESRSQDVMSATQLSTFKNIIMLPREKSQDLKSKISGGPMVHTTSQTFTDDGHLEEGHVTFEDAIEGESPTYGTAHPYNRAGGNSTFPVPEGW